MNDLSLLRGRKAAEWMKVITVKYDNLNMIPAVNPTHFSGDCVGDLPNDFDVVPRSLSVGKVHLSLETNAEQVADSPLLCLKF